ncbi:MAG: DNA-cytosine methyltransferase [Pedosphaera sp.]|nr:DNA-cytosine methyltransferase [Pedosphaera sp.]
MATPIIDLFAGPGGLGEGFSSLLDAGGASVFEIALSIEKDPIAHKTLELRSFYRQFIHQKKEIPELYYEYLRGKTSRKQLFKAFAPEAKAAAGEAWCAELGSDALTDRFLDQTIAAALQGRKSWVLIGGPPCQAYSLVGRSRMMGDKDFEEDHRHFLYRQYLRIISEHRPPVFVMENVKGLLSAKVKGQKMFDKIRSDLECPPRALGSQNGKLGDLSYRLISLVKQHGDLPGKYEPEDYVVHSENYGIPQTRHRIIFLGIRNDIVATPRILKEHDAVNIETAICDLPVLRSGLSKEKDSPENWLQWIREAATASWLEDKKLDKDLRRALQIAAQTARIGLNRGGESVEGESAPTFAQSWFRDPRLKCFCNHSTRSHIREDLHRYLFVAAFANVRGQSPSLENFPKALLPNHKNVGEALTGTKFNDRFRVQTTGRPSTTITSHISKDGHYFIHYDPTQCRSLTVREAARLQTFPDNYFFEGPRTQQYHQVGNAVPPLLAKQIAEIVADLIS